jgi:Fe-S-cluster containining protein
VESWDLPQLRPDLELLGAGVDLLVYDPARRDLFDLDAADRPVLRLLDGRHTLEEIARQAHRPLDDVLDLVDDLSDMLLLVDPDQDELLAAWQTEHEVEDRLLQPALDSRPAEGLCTYPIHVVDDARHTCLRCGACCHYAVPVSPEERSRLEEHHWPAEVVPEETGRLFQTHPGLQWGRLEETTATRSQPTRCAFLDVGNLCCVQQELGPAAKPFPCRLFPLAYPVLTPESILFSLSFECPWLHQTYDSGERLAHRVDDLSDLVASMEELYVLPASIPLDEERTLDQATYLSWERALLAGSAAPATDPAWFLEAVQSRWEEIAPGSKGVIQSLQELAGLAQALAQAVRENRAVVVGSPEGEEGADWAVLLLEGIAARPEAAWADVRWADGPAADRFLGRFVRNFIEGKQALYYRTLLTGLRALSVVVLLARRDAARMERESVSLAALNRALARWCRLLDIRPVRLAFLSLP